VTITGSRDQQRHGPSADGRRHGRHDLLPRPPTLTQTAGTGTTTLQRRGHGTNAAGGISLTGTNLALNNTLTTTGTGPVTLNESGTITLAAAGDIVSDGAVSLTATGGISTAGDITTTADLIDFNSNTTLTGPVSVSPAPTAT
jgi:hypothetical protein